MKKKKIYLILLIFFIFSILSFTSFKIAKGLLGKSDDVNNHIDDAYYVTSDESSVTYDSFKYVSNMGVVASLTEKDSLVFNNVIDLKEFDKNTTFIEVEPLALERGKCDYYEIDLKIIDCYDKNNFINVKMRPYPGLEAEGNVIFLNAWANNGQSPTAKDRDEELIMVNSTFGLWVYGSLSCIDNVPCVAPNINYVGLTYDYNENKLYCLEQYTGSLFLLCDFDDPNFFGDYVWPGFKDGCVYCTLKCSDYQGINASVMVKKYGNYDLSDRKLKDDISPVINIDYMGYNNDFLPVAVVGKDYKLFDCSSFDTNDGIISTEVSAYLNYYSNNKIKINSKGGIINPQVPSLIYVEYKAKDRSGNEKIEVININAVLKTEDISMEFVDFKMDAVLGETYKLPSYNLCGGSGKLDVSVTAKIGDNEVEIKNNTIKLLSLGKLELTYTIKDYINQELIVKKEVTINKSTELFFENAPDLPKYLICGNVYYFDDLYARDYITKNGEEVKADIYVIENGSEVKLQNNEYKAKDLDKVTISYKATSSGATSVYQKEIDVVNIYNDNALDMTKLFATNSESNIEAKMDYVALYMSTDASFEFINVLSSINLSTEFKFNASKNKVNRINIFLTDYSNDLIKIKFTYEIRQNGIYFFVNDNSQVAQKVNVDKSNLSSFLLSYKDDTRSVSFDSSSNKSVKIDKTVSEEEFNGFTSHLCYLEYTLEGVSSDVEIDIINVGSQFLNDEYFDYVAPTIDFTSIYGGEVVKGSTIDIPKIISVDGINGLLPVTLKITDPSGNVITSTSGIYLNEINYKDNISIVVNEYGLYNVTFVAKDLNNNTTTLSYGIRVVDIEMPSISLESDFDESYECDSIVEIPKVVVSDNYTKDLKTKIIIFSPSGIVSKVESNIDSFTAREKGLYKIVFIVFDEAGNFNEIVKTVRVK